MIVTRNSGVPLTKLSSLTFFLDIESFSPSAGSIYGGTLITIRGVGFSDNPDNVKVFVAGMMETKATAVKKDPRQF